MTCSLRTAGCAVSITMIWLGILGAVVVLSLDDIDVVLECILLAICLEFAVAAAIMFFGITLNLASYLCPMLFTCYILCAAWVCFVFYCSEFFCVFISTPFALVCFLLIYLICMIRRDLAESLVSNY